MKPYEGKLIYLVDDDKIVAELTSRTIQNSLGCDVKRFDNGTDLLTALKQGTPDVLLLDYYLDMSDHEAMNGLEVMEELNDGNVDVPVLFLTGLTDEKILEDLKASGVREILDKNEEDILDRIEKTLPKYL